MKTPVLQRVRPLVLVVFYFAGSSTTVFAEEVYLNQSNITVALGPSMSAQPFANRTTAASLASIIDAPSATSPEFHNQSTHVWVSGGALELLFDFHIEYDLTTLHFWNYHSEGFDVDNIDFTFYDGAHNQVGTLFGVAPALGNNSGSDANPILAQNYALSFPSRVRYVNAVLTGSNGQVDFNNVGFSGNITAVPEASTITLFGLGAIALWSLRRNRNS